MNGRFLIGGVLVCALAATGAWFWLSNSTSGNAGVDVSETVRSSGGAGGGGGRGGPRETLVITRPVSEAVTGDRLTAIGDGEAAASVTVTPRDNGVLFEVPVVSGQLVARGDLIARLDDELESIALDIATRAVTDAGRSRDRLEQLVRSRAGAQADLDEAENALARAELARRDAALKLERRSLFAPLDGRVGIVSVGPGDRVGTATEIVTIDDRSTLLVDFRVSERFASRVLAGQPVSATAFAAGGAIDGEIVAVGNRVDRDSRTLPVRAAIDNSDDRLRPGMSFSVQLRFAGEMMPAVDPLALQWDSTGSFVWKVVDDQAIRTAVRIVQRNPEAVLVQGEIAPGDEVVTEGVLSLRDGAPVRVAGAARRNSAPSSDPAGTRGTTAGTDARRPAGKSDS